jgi:hypothetical protein
MNLTILDNVIAVVLVILSLSLVVQSIQGFLKKLFKIKSRQLEQSLVDLFRVAIGTPGEKIQVRMPILQVRSGPAGLPAADSGHEVRVLYDAVTGGFQEIGRVAASGKSIMDSVSKEDLLKVLQRVNPASVMPGKAQDLQRACKAVFELGTVLDETRALVSDSAVAAKLAVIQEQFTPLLNDVKRIFDGQAIASTVIVGDLVNLRGLRTAEVLEVVAAGETKVIEDRSSTAEGSPERAALDKVLENLKKLSLAIETAGQSAEAAVGMLSARIKQIEDWYDTIMQSFSERYNRSMRTWVIVLGFVVAFALNADLFSIYRNISADATTRQLILSSRETQRLQQPNQATGGAGQPNAAAELNKARQEVIDSTSLYSSYGFGWPMNPNDWGSWSFWHYVAGCLVMGLLLSVGAPFWEDTLESLFGIKSLLGKQSGTAPAAASATRPAPSA